MVDQEIKTHNPRDITEGLKSLLLARARGEITQDEFEQRQALLHAQILSSEPEAAFKAKNSFERKSFLPMSNTVLAIIAVVAVSIAMSTWYILGKKNGAPAANEDIAALGAALSNLQGSDHALSLAEPEKNTPVKNMGGDLATAAKHLVEKLEKDPNNGDGWLLLARSYGQLRQPKEAADAYAKAAKYLAPDAAMLADWADAQVMSHEGKWDNESAALVIRAIAADPKNIKALALAGSEAFVRADYPAAIEFWKQMKALTPPDSMDTKLADSNIAEAQARLSGKNLLMAK